MPKVNANGININYVMQGVGEPLVLIPFLSADNGCYTFQLPIYSGHFTCYVIDPRGAGLSDKPEGPYTINQMSDDLAAFMDATALDTAHIAGVSMGAGIALQFAVNYPEKVKSLSLHGVWVKTDQHLGSLVNNWKIAASSIGNVIDAMATAVFPLCLSPELYISDPEYVKSLYDFMKDRPKQPVHGFISQCDAVMSHDCIDGLEKITAPTYATFGRRDIVTPPGIHAEIIQEKIPSTEIKIFDDCLHSPILEKTKDFNAESLDFLIRNSY